jgi:hypothetical protein
MKRDIKIYSWKYFTVKNVLTGAIKQTAETYTIHHFSSQYHSEDWRKNRIEEQRISSIFGVDTLMSTIVHKIINVEKRLKREGPVKAAKHYFNLWGFNSPPLCGG